MLRPWRCRCGATVQFLTRRYFVRVLDLPLSEDAEPVQEKIRHESRICDWICVQPVAPNPNNQV